MPQIKEILATMDYGPAPEDASHVRAWLKAHGGGFGHVIDGAFTTPSADRSFAIREPARDEAIATCAQGSAADVDAAVSAARVARPGRLAHHGRSRRP